MSELSHWDKTMHLIELAKQDDTVRKTLREGSPSEIADVLRRVDIDLGDVAKISEDLSHVFGASTRGIWLKHPGPKGRLDPGQH